MQLTGASAGVLLGVPFLSDYAKGFIYKPAENSGWGHCETAHGQLPRLMQLSQNLLIVETMNVDLSFACSLQLRGMPFDGFVGTVICTSSWSALRMTPLKCGYCPKLALMACYIGLYNRKIPIRAQTSPTHPNMRTKRSDTPAKGSYSLNLRNTAVPQHPAVQSSQPHPGR
jgi:hypothetical protein